MVQKIIYKSNYTPCDINVKKAITTEEKQLQTPAVTAAVRPKRETSMRMTGTRVLSSDMRQPTELATSVSSFVIAFAKRELVSEDGPRRPVNSRTPH